MDRQTDMEQARMMVRAVLTEMGIDMSTPEATIEVQKDFAFLREWRQATVGTRRFLVRSVLLMIISGLIGLAWAGFQHLPK